MENLCTLHELRTVYSLSDLHNFHEVLNLKREAQHIADVKAKKEK